MLNDGPKGLDSRPQSAVPLHEKLKKKRLEAGLDLDDLAAETRVLRTYLEAIEAGKLHLLPAGLYARNFLRLYLKGIGMTDANLVEDIVSKMAVDISLPAPHSSVLSVTHPDPPKLTPYFMALLLLCLLGGIAWAVWHYVYNRDPTSSQTFVTTEKIASNRQQKEGKKGPAAQGSAGIPHGERIEPPTPSNVESAAAQELDPPGSQEKPGPAGDSDSAPVLEILATEEAWLRMSRPGGWSKTLLLEKNETTELLLDEPTNLWTGNAGAVRLSIGGKLFKPLGKRGEIIKILLDPDDYGTLLAKRR